MDESYIIIILFFEKYSYIYIHFHMIEWNV